MTTGHYIPETTDRRIIRVTSPSPRGKRFVSDSNNKPAQTTQRTETGTAGKASPGVLHFIWLGLRAGLFALIAVLGIAVILVPMTTGSTPLTILTSSMEPTLPPGTLIIVKPTPIEDIRLGDVITYQIRSGHPEVITHRVVGIAASGDGSTSFITQGDNNNIADENPVIEPQIRGTVWYSVPLIGYASTALNGSNRAWIVPVIAIALFLYAAYMIAAGIIGSVRSRRKRRETQIANTLESADTVNDADEIDPPSNLDKTDSPSRMRIKPSRRMRRRGSRAREISR